MSTPYERWFDPPSMLLTGASSDNLETRQSVARRRKSFTVTAAVTNALQTSTGRLIFARVAGHADGDESNGPEA